MKNPTPKNHLSAFEPFIYRITIKKKLNRNFKKINADFLDVLLSRRSDEILCEVSAERISQLLYYSNKIHSIHQDDSGYINSKRTSPSAGARHPIDLLISHPKKNGERILEYYNPIDHSLNKLSIDTEVGKLFFREINDNVPIDNSCIIWFSIQINKTKSKYESAESLYWRDTGALLYCIQLVSTYLGLKSCPIGSLASKPFYGLFNSNDLISGGGILIGT